MKVKFDENFLFGAATSAFQIEGALNEDGRGELFWDHILKSFNADPNIACDHYHRYKEDIRLMKDLGLETYRFSISWVRIVPDGSGDINQKGIEFYNDLIDELISNEIKPLITLSHFDVPFIFYKKGGWKNQEIIDAYHRYVKVCLENFGDRVDYWLTFNEPWVDQYLINIMMKSPGIKKSGEMFADCLNSIHNLFIAHAKTIETFHHMDKDNKVGIALNLGPGYPHTDSDDDKKAAMMFDEFLNTWFLELAINGRYNSNLFKYYQESVGAPEITDEDKILLKNNKSDFIGVNFYGPFIIKASKKNFPLNYEGFQGERSKDWANNAKVVPEGLFEILMRIKDHYGNPTTFITENGCSFGDEELNDIKDEWRIDYVKKHLREVKRAIDNGVNVKRYYLWSLMDNLEWIQGYEERYGLIYIDREHNLERKIKKSGNWYSKLIKNREFTI